MKKTAVTVAIFMATATQIAAQGFTGGEVTLGYSAFTGDLSSLDAVTLQGSAEFDINQSFGLQGDISTTQFGLTNFDATSFVLHGIYHVNDRSSVGIFIGNESIEGEVSDFAGIELGADFQALGIEAYFAKPLDSLIDDANVFGIAGKYAVSDAFKIVGTYDRVGDDSDSSVSRTMIGAEYELSNGLALYAETGNGAIKSGGSSDSQSFYGVGATYRFGANRGATFNNRGIAQLIPGL